MNAAIEAAARAKLRWNFPSLSDADIDEMLLDHVEEMRAAISAYLVDVPVSEGMVDAGVMASCLAWDAEQVRRWLPLILKAMCRQHAEELNKGVE